MNCRFVQVCVQLPTSAVNVSLLVLAAERRAATPCCGATAPGSPTAAALVRYLLPARRSAANPPHAAAAVERREERRTYARPFHRPCFRHYARSVNKLAYLYAATHQYCFCKTNTTTDHKRWSQCASLQRSADNDAAYTCP